METKEAILQLRRGLGLSQSAFAKKILVTRQAVSRWETGETIPNIDTLKLMARTFCVSVDSLLGHSESCQSCGMHFEKDGDRGTEKDGRKSPSYCAFCYQAGAFTKAMTMEEMAEANLCALDEWNKENDLELTREEARAQLLAFLPTLMRWRKQENGGQ